MTPIAPRNLIASGSAAGSRPGGKRKPEDTLHATGNDSDQNCEYSFYVGEYRALRGERPEALALFRSARDGCPKDFVEYVPALIELNNLEKQK